MDQDSEINSSRQQNNENTSVYDHEIDDSHMTEELQLDQRGISIPQQQKTQLKKGFEYQQIEKTGNTKISKLNRLQLLFFEYWGDQKKRNTVIKNSIAILLVLTCHLLFSSMDHVCNEPSTPECIEKVLVPQTFRWTKILMIIGFIYVFVFFLSMKRRIHQYIKYLVIADFIYLAFLKFDMTISKITVQEFGSAQSYLLVVFTIIMAILFFIGYLFSKLYKKSRVIFGTICFILVALCFYVYHKINVSCSGWEKGLTGEILQDESHCSIQKPDICLPVILNNAFNFGRKTCAYTKQEKENLKNRVINYYKIETKNSSDINYITWPKTNDYYSENEVVWLYQQYYFLNHTQTFKTLDEAQKVNSETILDLIDGKLMINVVANETFVERQNEVEKQFKQEKPEMIKEMAKDVIIIYIDTLSRAQAHRKLPKSMEFLKQFTKEAQKEEEQKSDIYEFYRFHSIDKKTSNNALMLHYGYQRYDFLENKIYKTFPEDKQIPNIIKEFKDAGYITAHAMNTCTSQCQFRGQNFSDFRHFFVEENADHQYLTVDPLYMNPQNYFDTTRGVNSMYRRCLYGDDSSAHVFEYGSQFLDAYKDQKKFLFMEFTDSHEVTSEIVQFVDDHLENFLQRMKSQGIFDGNSVVYLLSDHGQHIVNSIMPQYENSKKNPTNNSFQVERMLPLLQMVVGKNVSQSNSDETNNINDNLETNQQKLFSMEQVRNTILTSKRGKDDKKFADSLWSPINPNYRCKDFKMSPELGEQFCFCKSTQ